MAGSIWIVTLRDKFSTSNQIIHDIHKNSAGLQDFALS